MLFYFYPGEKHRGFGWPGTVDMVTETICQGWVRFDSLEMNWFAFSALLILTSEMHVDKKA